MCGTFLMVIISHKTSLGGRFVLERHIVVMFYVVFSRLCANVGSADVVNVATFARWQLTVTRLRLAQSRPKSYSI